jgi:hypothetical protein
VRARAHLEIARLGSRVALDVLHQTLADGRHRVELEIIAALERIGAREDLPFLLAAYDREDASVQARIGATVRTIMKRERIRRTDRIFRTLGADQRRALAAILPPVRQRRRGLPAEPAGSRAMPASNPTSTAAGRRRRSGRPAPAQLRASEPGAGD